MAKRYADMDTIEAFLAITGRSEVYAPQMRQVEGKFSGRDDPETKASLFTQIEALTIQYCDRMGVMPAMDDIAPFVDLRPWRLAENGPWKHGKAPFVGRTIHANGGALPEQHRNPVLALYLENDMAPDAEGVAFWTEQAVEAIRPAFLAAARESGRIE